MPHHWSSYDRQSSRPTRAQLSDRPGASTSTQQSSRCGQSAPRRRTLVGVGQRDRVQRLRGTRSSRFGQRNRGDHRRRAKRRDISTHDRQQRPCGQLLCFQQSRWHCSPESEHSGTRRALVTSSSSTCGKFLYFDQDLK